MPGKPFRTKVESVPHGGQYVVVPTAVAERAGLRHAARVRGRVNAVPYRSSLMKHGGVFHLGVHKAVLAEAGLQPGARVAVTIELDDQPLPADVVPDDLAAALKRSARAAKAWEALRPSRKREHVQAVTGAKKAETRARRVAKLIAELLTACLLTFGGIGGIAMAMLAGCGDELFLMHELHVSTPEVDEMPVGAGCESIDGDDTSAHGVGGLGRASFMVDHQLHDGDGVSVVVRDANGRVLDGRAYNDEFLRSGKVDEFSADLGAGNTLHLRYWGGTTCEEPREPEG